MLVIWWVNKRKETTYDVGVSHLSTAFSLTQLKKKSLHMLREEIISKGPIHIYSCVLFNPHASHGKGQPEVAFE